MRAPRTAVAADDAAADEGALILEVAAGDHSRRDAVVEFALPEALRGDRPLRLTALDDGVSIPVQRTAEGAGVAWRLSGKLAAGERRRFRLAPAPLSSNTPESDGNAGVSISQADGKLTVRVGDKPVLVYHTAVAHPPKPLDAAYRRSGFIHPLYTPDGRILTDGFPPDHAHQHGVFFAWVNTLFDGRPVDFWNQRKGAGTVEHAAVERVSQGPVCGEFRVTLRHLDLTATEAPRTALEETWTVRVYNSADPFLIDLESRQRCGGEEPLVINKYHYGGLAVRGNRAWFDPRAQGVVVAGPANGHSDFLTSEGHGRAQGNHTRPRWVDLYGNVDDRPCGVAVFDHPDNFRFPQAVRLHPTKPYFCFSPMVEKPLTIAPGDEYVSRYRFLTHNNLPDRGRIDQRWREFASPLRARVVE